MSSFTSLPTYVDLATSTANAAASSSAAGLSTPAASTSLRLSLVEESNRLLRQELAECGRRAEAYKSQLYALEKHKLDLREEVRTLAAELDITRNTLEDRRFAEREQERETAAQVEAMRAAAQSEIDALRHDLHTRTQELSDATRRLGEREDELYRERKAFSAHKHAALEQAAADRVWKQGVQTELRTQLRALCLERNQATTRCTQLVEDLTAARRTADDLAREKTDLLNQLYDNSKLAKQTPRDCMTAEAALLALQKTEIANLTRRLAQVESSTQERLETMRHQTARQETELIKDSKRRQQRQRVRSHAR